jgi:hypothetical protein
MALFCSRNRLEAALLAAFLVLAATPSTRAATPYGHLPMSFEENRGQTDSRVKFLARGAGYSLFLTPTEAVLKLRGGMVTTAAAYRAHKYSMLRMRLMGANAGARPRGIDALPAKSNYFIGSDRARWRTGVATFAGVEFESIYPGIDVIYRGTDGRLEYDFTIAPGADPARIRIGLEGARWLSIDADGGLIIATANGSVVQHAPIVYQISRGAKRIVSGTYTMRGSRTVGFAIGAYDRKLPLVIDPLLSYASYLGGSLIDFATAIAVDASGNAVVTGYTDSADFPLAAGAFQPGLFEAAGGPDDVFIAKINAAGTALIYSTYAGGSNEDEGASVAVDAADNAYIAGFTMSPDFPATIGAFQPTFSGTQSAFVTALDQSGGLIYSTFLNGSATASAAGIAADAAGSAFVTGVTTSTDFPVTAGAYQATFDASSAHDRAAFVTRLNPSGTALEYSTYLGPPDYMAGKAIALDASGNAYLAGTMYAGGVAGGARCPINNNDCGFAARLDSAGAQLEFSTLIDLAEKGFTQAQAIAVDTGGGAHVVGNFGLLGSQFGFLQNFASSGAALNIVNFSQALSPHAIALGASGNLFIAGTVFGANLTTSPGAFQPSDAGSVNAYLNEYDPSGTATLYSTYLGGSDQDEAFGVAVDSFGNAYLAGYTQSSDFPVTLGALQSEHGGGIAHAGTLDAFVARIVTSPALAPTPTSTPTWTPAPTITAAATPTAVPTASATPIPSSTESIGVMPNPLRFRTAQVGRPSALKFVNVINPKKNQVAVAIMSISLRSTGAGDFTLDASRSTCTPGLLLSAGKSCKVAITFAPTSIGVRKDTLFVVTGPSTITKVVPLHGTGR